MAKYINEEYSANRSRKHKRYSGVLHTFWDYDGDFVGRVERNWRRPQSSGLAGLEQLPVFLPHSDGGTSAWLDVETRWSMASEKGDLCIVFTACEDRESKLPDAEEIWKRVAHRLSTTTPGPCITKMLGAEERGLAIANLAAKVSNRSGATLKAMTEEARDIAKDACDYDRRLMLLKAEYEHVFRAEMIRVGNALHTDKTEDLEGPLVIRWCQQKARTVTRGPGGGFFDGHTNYQPDYDAVIKWLTYSPGMGWADMLDAFAGRDNRP